MGVLLGTINNTSEVPRYSRKVFNNFDYSLMEATTTWNEDSNHIFSTRPLLSTDLYYNYLLGAVKELTPAGMFEFPEKSQVYLDLLRNGCIGTDMGTLMLSLHDKAYSYSEVKEIMNSGMIHVTKNASVIRNVFKELRELSEDLHSRLAGTLCSYIPIGEPEVIRTGGASGVIDCTILVSSLGEVLIKCTIFSDLLYKKYTDKPRALFIYVDTLCNINILTDGRSSKQEIKQYLKNILQLSAFKYENNVYKLVLVKVLFNVLETSGDMFDFALQMSKEQQCSIVREGIWAGLVSSIKHPQDGSITDLLSCIANKVTYGSYYKRKLVNTNFSKLRSSVGPKGKHENEKN